MSSTCKEARAFESFYGLENVRRAYSRWLSEWAIYWEHSTSWKFHRVADSLSKRCAREVWHDQSIQLAQVCSQSLAIERRGMGSDLADQSTSLNLERRWSGVSKDQYHGGSLIECRRVEKPTGSKREDQGRHWEARESCWTIALARDWYWRNVCDLS